MQTICVVEDDELMRQELCVLLESNSYRVRALSCFDNAVQDILATAPQLVLLDLSLPGVDGQLICRELRKNSSVPIVVVTSRDTETDELLALAQGADDFVAKPYNAQVLLAHIASVLKRTYGTQEVQNLSYAGLLLDMERMQVTYQDSSADLTKNELKILAHLLRAAPRVVARGELQEELWATDAFIDDNTLTVNISHLRQTLSQLGAGELLHTKRGVGYYLKECELTPALSPASSPAPTPALTYAPTPEPVQSKG